MSSDPGTPGSRTSDQVSDSLEKLKIKLEDCQKAISIDFDRLLRCATGAGNLEICKFLIEKHSANPRSRDIVGLSPVIYAGTAPCNYITILKFLAKTMGIKAFLEELDHRDRYGRTAMHYALYLRPAPVLQFCYMQGGGTDFCDDDINTQWKSLHEPREGSMLIMLLYTRSRSLLKVPLFISGAMPDGESSDMDKIHAEYSKPVSLENPDFFFGPSMRHPMQYVRVPFTNVCSTSLNSLEEC